MTDSQLDPQTTALWFTADNISELDVAIFRAVLYRNLALRLGATVEDMVTSGDRWVAERWESLQDHDEALQYQEAPTVWHGFDAMAGCILTVSSLFDGADPNNLPDGWWDAVTALLNEARETYADV